MLAFSSEVLCLRPHNYILAQRVRIVLVLAALGAPRGLPAQALAPRVSVDERVDTTVADLRQIVRLVSAYLVKPDSSARARGLWSTADSMDRRIGDLDRFWAYQGYPATVLSVIAQPPGDSVYVVKILHASADSTSREIDVWTVQRLYAVRVPSAPYGWQLSNALARTTRSWASHTVGRITFHYAPGLAFDAAKAKASARFVDSVAILFDVPPPPRIDYYVARSPDEYWRAAGLDFVMQASEGGPGTGGNAFPEIGFVFAGDSAQGEAYLHELTHIVLRRGYGGAHLGEGIPIWLGGARGRSAHTLYSSLVDYQHTHPTVTIEKLLGGDLGAGAIEDQAINATAALFVDAVCQRSGVAGLRSLRTMPAGQDGLFGAMRTRLGLSTTDPTALDRWWREYAEKAAR